MQLRNAAGKDAILTGWDKLGQERGHASVDSVEVVSGGALSTGFH